MFFTYFVFLILSISNAIAKPQLFTFKDGNVGVNFLGFNAQAGLGGLLTGNTAHGGLSASAGTPFGQRAAAGIGGRNGDGGTYGGAFAAATAGNGVSAGAGLGGNAATGGVLGAEASAGGVTKNVIKTVGTVQDTSEIHNEYPPTTVSDQPNTGVVQKIKPPKKYGVGHIIEEENNGDNDDDGQIDVDTRLTKTNDESIQLPKANTNINIEKTIITSIKPQLAASAVVVDKSKSIVDNSDFQTSDVVLVPQSKVLTYRKKLRPFRQRLNVQKYLAPISYQQPLSVEVEKRNQPAVAPIEYSKTKTTILATPSQGSQTHSVSAEGQFNSNGFFDGIFNIPISTLRALNDFLNQGFAQGSVGVRKTVNVQTH
ncbi:PE-PGRS family protein PE_PGRS18 [Condylostylus longicornis]|uniref:PE-PGRS family protein PE_PGRS18 n=1 Tax=Condylostylus longicornis TaxID=2530218 RepID=UPI00244D9988|nr:PE-PGRS family protein PE_PGRS18 [Condylostylus longicornis]